MIYNTDEINTIALKYIKAVLYVLARFTSKLDSMILSMFPSVNAYAYYFIPIAVKESEFWFTATNAFV